MKIIGSAPILLVEDVQKSADYWINQVGFTATHFEDDPPTFCILRRDGFHLMLAKANRKEDIQPNWKVLDKTSNIYFFVDDAKALYEDLIKRGAKIDWELYEAPYGCLEFGIQDLDGHDIAFGQDLDA